MNYALKHAHQVRKEIFIVGFTVKIHSSPKNRSNTKYIIIIYFQLFAKLKTVMGRVYSPLITRTNSIADAQVQIEMADILTHHGVPSR